MQSAQRQTFGALVRHYRRAAAMTQAELADKAGLSVYSISNIERDIVRIPHKDTVRLLSRALQLNERERATLERAASQQRGSEPAVAALPTLWGVPLARNPFFTGRDDMLRQIHDALHAEQTAPHYPSCTLSGLGGMGKTQTVIEYAYRYASTYSAVFWIQAETKETINASIVSFAHVLDLPECQERDQSRVIAAVSRWLTRTNGWLIIFDNVEDVELVKAVLPPTDKGTLLFTTRRQALDISARTLILDKMTAEESQRFLLHRARLSGNSATPEHLIAEEEAAAQEIVAALDGLPLALDQAGAYIEATRCSLGEYCRLFRASPSRLLDEREPHADHPLSVFRTVTVACEQIERRDPQATALLTACAFLAPDEIPESLFIQGAEQLGMPFVEIVADPFQFQAAVKVLLIYSLIQRHPATQTITIHRLVQTVLQDRLPEAERRSWAERVTAALATVFPLSEKAQADYWQVCERLMPHVLVCLAASDHWETDVAARAGLMNHAATYLANLARFAEAERLNRRALHLCEQAFGVVHPLMAEALTGLARVSREHGEYVQAESLILRALEVRERIFGAGHPKIASTLNNLASLYVEQARYEQAEALYRRALQIQEQSFDSPHPFIASTLNNLANLHFHQGKYEQAEIYYRQALQMWEQSLGAEHPTVTLPLYGLAETYQQQGRLAEAEPLVQRALRIVEHTLGDEHPHVIDLLTLLARLYVEQHRFAEAEMTYRRVLHIRQHTLEAPHPLIAATLDALADLYMRQGRREEAEVMRQRGRDIWVALQESTGSN